MDKLPNCKICNVRIAGVSCGYCGKPICHYCYDIMSGLCKKCKEGRKIK